MNSCQKICLLHVNVENSCLPYCWKISINILLFNLNLNCLLLSMTKLLSMPGTCTMLLMSLRPSLYHLMVKHLIRFWRQMSIPRNGPKNPCLSPKQIFQKIVIIQIQMLHSVAFTHTSLWALFNQQIACFGLYMQNTFPS